MADRLVEQLEDALRGGHRRLQDVELLRHVGDGPEEPLRVEQEGDERPERQGSLEHRAPAVPDRQGRRQRADHVDGRIEHGVVEDRLDVRDRGAPR